MLNNFGLTASSRTSARAPLAILSVAATCLFCTSLRSGAAFAQEAASVTPAYMPAEHLNDPSWAERHESVKQSAKARPDTQLLLIGDSITNNYDEPKRPNADYQPIWKRFYEPRKALNLGFSGDTTSNVLWRLDHGEVEGLSPKVAVLLIGTNNTLHGQTAEETESGIDAVVSTLERLLPETRVLLLGILPSDRSAGKTEKDLAVNRYLAACYSENPRVTYLDIGAIFLKKDGINNTLFEDPKRATDRMAALHPDTNGQRMMAEAIEPTLAKLMHDTPKMPLEQMTDINTAVIPVDRLEIDSYDWYARHHAELDLAKRIKPKVVLIGDSITHFWGGSPASNPVNGAEAWQHAFGSMPAMNMGFGWDRTQNVLWRLRQGELDGLNPEWIVLLIGTNNLTETDHARANSPQEIVQGIEVIYGKLRAKSPQSKIVLMAILPRGGSATGPLRMPITETNRLLAQRFAMEPGVVYLDIGSRFLQPDGSLPAILMPDGTHPSNAGYQIWADALIAAGIKP